MRWWRRQSGQASVELVAVLPALLVVVAICVQLTVAGHALWTSANAARAGARAAHVDGNAREAARSAIPKPLRREARIRERASVSVALRAPELVPGAGEVPLRARSALYPAAGG